MDPPTRTLFSLFHVLSANHPLKPLLRTTVQLRTMLNKNQDQGLDQSSNQGQNKHMLQQLMHVLLQLGDWELTNSIPEFLSMEMMMAVTQLWCWAQVQGRQYHPIRLSSLPMVPTTPKRTIRIRCAKTTTVSRSLVGKHTTTTVVSTLQKKVDKKVGPKESKNKERFKEPTVPRSNPPFAVLSFAKETKKLTKELQETVVSTCTMVTRSKQKGRT